MEERGWSGKYLTEKNLAELEKRWNEGKGFGVKFTLKEIGVSFYLTQEKETQKRKYLLLRSYYVLDALHTNLVCAHGTS